MGTSSYLVTHILQNIFCVCVCVCVCVFNRKKNHTGLEQLEGEKVKKTYLLMHYELK